MIRNRMNKINQMSKFVSAIADAMQIDIDSLKRRVVQCNSNLFFDSCSEDCLKLYEAEAGITPMASQTLEDRRSALVAKWRAEGKCDITLLQAVADSWKYGRVTVDFVDAIIVIRFVDKGIPTDIDGLKKALEEIKPAHLPINYIFIYNTWNDIACMTWGDVAASTWDELKVR